MPRRTRSSCERVSETECRRWPPGGWTSSDSRSERERDGTGPDKDTLLRLRRTGVAVPKAPPPARRSDFGFGSRS